MSGPSPVLPPGSGVSATAAKGSLLSGGKAVVALVLTVAVVAGAAGLGLWLYLHPSPKLQVVQRNTSQIFLSGPGKKTLVARCFANETLLGGGYDAPGAIVTRSDKVDGQQAWWVDFVTETGGEIMTAYALCVNAKLDTQTNAYTMSQYKPFEPGIPLPSCSPGFTATALGFYLDSHLLGRLTPVPMREMLPRTSDTWFFHLAPTTNPNHAPFPQARIADRPEEHYYVPQMTAPDAAYTFAYFRLLCVLHLTSVSQVDQSISVGAQGTSDGVANCPTGAFVLGGGYAYTDSNTDGRKNSSYDDGWLYASRNAPATPGTASGAPVTGWYVTAVNHETAGATLEATVWFHQTENEHSPLFGNSDMYLDNHAESTDPRVSDDQNIITNAAPAARPLILRALCSKIDAEPTAPPKLSLVPFTLPTPTQVPIPSPVATAAPSPTAIASPTPASQPSPTPQKHPTATPQPQSPPKLNVGPNPVTEYCGNGQWPNTLTVRNKGGGTLTWQASAPNAPGVHLSSTSGSLTAGASKVITLSGQTGQSFTISFTSNGGQASVAVTCQ